MSINRIILPLFVLLILTPNVFGQTTVSDISISPNNIDLRLIKHPLGTLSAPELDVTLNVHISDPDVTIIDVYADTFFEKDNRWPPISRNMDFTITNNIKNGFRRCEIDIKLSLPSNIHASSYESMIYVKSSSGSVVEVPLKIEISESEWIVGLLILVGVLLNLTLFLIKETNDERNTLQDTLETTELMITNAYNAICDAIRGRRFEDLGPASTYMISRLEFDSLIDDWNKAIERRELPSTFNYLKKWAERITELAIEAGDVVPKVNIVPLEYLKPPKSYNARKSSIERLRVNQLVDYMWRSRSLQYFALFITFGIVVVSSWQKYLTEAIVFGSSGISDYLAAILFGFGSQTVLTQGFGIAKGWAESR